MSSNFDWQTEEENRPPRFNWEEPPPPPPASPRRLRVRWRWVAVIVVLGIAVGLVIRQRLQQRIEANLQAIRSDVVSSHNLVQTAAAEGDEELFRSMLSGRDPSWTNAQLKLFEDGLFADRAPLGIRAVEDTLPAILPILEIAAAETAAAVELSPDLSEAWITTLQPFAAGEAPSDQQRINLLQTAVYRRGAERWLLSPPSPEFWGDTGTVTEGDLTVEYALRDEELAWRLAADLAADLERLCRETEDIRCPSGAQFTLRLETDAASLAALEHPLAVVRSAALLENVIELPTPTLVGLPDKRNPAQAEAAYQALRLGYSRQFLTGVIAEVVDWECCDRAPLFQALVDYQLAELGMGVWPVTPSDFRRVLDERIRLSDLDAYRRQTNPNNVPADRRWRVYAEAAFLIETFPELSPAEIQRRLTDAPNLSVWLDRLSADGFAPDEPSWRFGNLEQAWWLYALQAGRDASVSSSPPPKDELYLGCTTVDNTQQAQPSAFYRYVDDQTGWQELYTLDGFIWMSALPGHDTILLQEFSFADETWVTNLWRDGRHQRAYNRDDQGFSVSFGETDPQGRYLTVYTFDAEVGETMTLRLDMDSCRSGGCNTSFLPGTPVWSPDGRQAIYIGDSRNLADNTILSNERSVIVDSSARLFDQSLRIGPSPVDAPASAELQSIGRGHSPFWLDESTYGYIRAVKPSILGPTIEQEIVIFSPGEETGRTLLTSGDLAEFMPSESISRRMTIGYVRSHPVDPNLLFIVVLDELERMAYVFAYDRTTLLPELRLQLSYSLNHSLGFSPDGRYLVMTGSERSARPGDNLGVLLLHDIAANQTTPFLVRLPFFIPSVTYDWTADSRWLALALDDNLVGLVSPEEETVEILPHTYGVCTSLAWLSAPGRLDSRLP